MPDAQTPAVIPGSAEEFLEGGGGSWRDCCSADDEHIGDHASAHQALPESGERPFELRSVE